MSRETSLAAIKLFISSSRTKKELPNALTRLSEAILDATNSMYSSGIKPAPRIVASKMD